MPSVAQERNDDKCVGAQFATSFLGLKVAESTVQYQSRWRWAQLWYHHRTQAVRSSQLWYRTKAVRAEEAVRQREKVVESSAFEAGMGAEGRKPPGAWRKTPSLVTLSPRRSGARGAYCLPYFV